MSIKVFFHVCVLDGARSFDVLDRLIDAIMLSGLYAEVSTINCCVTGSPSLVHIAVQRLRQSGNKYTVLRVSPADPLTAERLTLGLVPGSVEDDDRVLYVHTKGVTRHNDSRVDDWTRMLTYFCVGRYRDCLAMLESNDVVGANYQTVPKPHFSGNFWWARGDFLRRLDPDAMSRTAKRGSQDWHVSPEMDFLFQDLSGHRPRVLSMHDSGVDHYRANYPRSEGNLNLATSAASVSFLVVHASSAIIMDIMCKNGYRRYAYALLAAQVVLFFLGMSAVDKCMGSDDDGSHSRPFTR